MNWKSNLLVGATAICMFGLQARADTVFTATLNGDSEAPSSPGSGYATVTVNSSLDLISYTLTFGNLSSDATMAHIHFGGPGTSGPILLWFFPPTLTPTPTAPSGSYSGTWTPANLSSQSQDPSITTFSELFSAMTSGNTYVNVHSVNFPNGEIRGQLVMVPEPASFLLVGVILLALAGCAVYKSRSVGSAEMGRVA
jgi:hypothetical protein